MSDGTSAERPGTKRQLVRVSCLHNPHASEIAGHIDGESFVWMDFESPTDEDLAEIERHIPLHPLTVEAARTFQQRPKREEYPDYTFLVVVGVDEGTESGGHLLREVHVIIAANAVITIHRRPFEALAEVRRQYADRELRSEHYLMYQILDGIVSTFVPVLSRIDDDIDDLEQEVIDETSSAQLQRIFSLKRDLVSMRRVVTAERDMFMRSAERITDVAGLAPDEQLYYRGLYDSLIRTSDLIDSYRDLLSGTTDMYLSQVANNQGEINKQLTIVATIFLPLTFLTGFFGQNFATLTNHVIDSEWSFWVLGIGLLAASVLGMLVWFKRNGWL